MIPGGMTSQFQVIDVVVNKPFKDYLRKNYSDWLINGNHAPTPTGKLKKPSIQLLGQWIITAWGKIKSESIVKGFKKCCVSNNMDGSEDDILWKDYSRYESDSSTSSEDELGEEEENEDDDGN